MSTRNVRLSYSHLNGDGLSLNFAGISAALYYSKGGNLNIHSFTGKFSTTTLGIGPVSGSYINSSVYRGVSVGYGAGLNDLDVSFSHYNLYSNYQGGWGNLLNH
ncbi:hypothetical protein ACG2LH_16570 [Zhouia sp. PK063]|uniref:hypothetical protein n=1 Tax=Zhouia sp. PK063 TaxID=3373602 RepID=UPI0037988723